MFIIRSFPLFAILWAAYNVFAFVLGDGDINKIVFSVALPSTATWNISIGDIFLLIGITFLYIEIFKATRTTTGSILDHVLSMVVFVGMLIQFILSAKAGNTTFAALTLMALVDVVAGFTVSIISARRDFGFGGNNPDI